MADLKAEIIKALDSDTNREKQIAALEAVVESAAKEKNAASGVLSALGWSGEPSAAARDPVEVMREVFKDDAFDQTEKYILFMMSNQRFFNRRKMAYRSLYAIIGGAIFIALAIFLDRFYPPGAGEKSLSDIIQANQSVITWIGGFFTSIVAFYFGASSLRPTS